ncbi:hypothetical protein BA190_03840 [Labrys sp. WJW]|nr:hypothetical protein BA190_03840 [Labrys sp. WJW]
MPLGSTAEPHGRQVDPSEGNDTWKKKKPSTALLTKEQFSGLVGCTIRQISKLIAEGVLTLDTQGRLELYGSVKSYCQRLVGIASQRQDATLQKAKIRQTEAAAEKIEIENKKKLGEYLDVAEVESEWSGILRDLRARMLAVPSRVAQRHGTLNNHTVDMIDREIRDALTELGNAK